MSDKGTILVVEDNDFVRMQIVSHLGEAGYVVLEAAEGEAALEKMREEKSVDLAVVDVRMEPMGGFEFIGLARSYGADMPVVLVTGDQNPDLLEKAGLWDVKFVLMKPVQKDRLVKVVERALEEKKRLSV